jgi:hypothetical protein
LITLDATLGVISSGLSVTSAATDIAASTAEKLVVELEDMIREELLATKI